jgi:hypothetical protein
MAEEFAIDRAISILVASDFTSSGAQKLHVNNRPVGWID